MEKILVIIGPTAIGKSKLGLYLAKKYNGEIVSADSMQVYRHLDIGTAKPSVAVRNQIPHYLIDIKNVNESYSVSEFVNQANISIKKIIKKGKLPIIVGGTGLYISSLLYNLSLGGKHTKRNSNTLVTNILKSYLSLHGKVGLWEWLKQVDPITANKVHPNNIRRVQRALEVYLITGKPFSALNQENNISNFNSYIIGLNTKRSILYQQINNRVDNMIAAGLTQEAQKLYDYTLQDLPSKKGIGYREYKLWFNDKASLDQVINKIKQDSRHYAKRQLTWFNNKLPVHWFDLIQFPNQIYQLQKDIEDWLSK